MYANMCKYQQGGALQLQVGVSPYQPPLNASMYLPVTGHFSEL